MIPIEEFPYGDRMNQKNPMHGKILLMKMKHSFDLKFAVGYYDACHDVFDVCYSPFMSSQLYYYDEQSIGGSYYSDHKCIIPKSFVISKGPRAVSEVILMDEALADMEDRGLFEEDIDKVFTKAKYCSPYLVCTKDRYILITETSSFCNYGTQFGVFEPVMVNGDLHHIHGILPKENIQSVVNLTAYYEHQNGE